MRHEWLNLERNRFKINEKWTDLSWGEKRNEDIQVDVDLKNRGVIKRNKKESAGLKKRGFKGGKKRAAPLE